MNIQVPTAAVAIVHAKGPEESVLLILRQKHPDDPWSGHWSFPGGRRDDTDADALETALRELREECGVSLERKQMRQALEPRPAHGGSHVFLVAPFVFEIPAPLPTELDSREAVQALWAPLSLLRDTARHCRQPVPGRPESERWPGIELEGVPLWGFTYRLICLWLQVEPPH